jgi:hypothetical protein
VHREHHHPPNRGGHRAPLQAGTRAGGIVLLAIGVLVGLFVYGYSSTLDAAMKARRPGTPPKTGVTARAGREVLPATDRAPQWTLP